MRRGPASEAPGAGERGAGCRSRAERSGESRRWGFRMGSHQPQFLDAKPVHRARVDGFYIEKIVVTASQLEAFAAVSGAAARMRPDVPSNASC